MRLITKLFVIVVVLLVLLAIVIGVGTFRWSSKPIIPVNHQEIAFTIKPSSSVRSTAQQMAAAGIPMNPWLFELFVRSTGKSSKLKAGSYDLDPGITPEQLTTKLIRGEFSLASLSIIEGWTFKQMRQAVEEHPELNHETINLSDVELLAKITTEYKTPEGLFFPDTYLFAKGSSDLLIYKQAHTVLIKRLNDAWKQRDTTLPYKSPYEALIMASIIEKETGQKSERGMIAGVFVNRLMTGMLLQTDPTVIYGMGDQYKGQIRKRDLQTDTPYNTYTRPGLPPTPIALPGLAAMSAAMHPAKTNALYFVARGNGTSQFSDNLDDHNRAVNQYQR